MMTEVWKSSPSKGSELLLLLALADHAHDDGSNAFPSIATLAQKTRMSSRSVSRLISRLVSRGELRAERRPGRSNRMTLVVTPDKLSPLTAVTPTHDTGDVTPMTPVSSITVSQPSLVTMTSDATQAKDEDATQEGDAGADVEGSLDVLRRAQWYPFDSARDRIPLATAKRSGKTDLLEDVRRWVERGNAEPPRHPRAALQGWLTVKRPSHPDTETREPCPAELDAEEAWRRDRTPEAWRALQAARAAARR